MRPSRIVDAHVHLWDPARTDWYPYLGGAMKLDMGDTTGMARRFDVATYEAEAQGWNVTKLVHVAAATGVHSIAEALEIDRLGEREPLIAAVIGGITPDASPGEIVGQIESQLAASRFRGVRPMGQSADPVPADEVLQALAERDLVFELLARPAQLAAAADRLAAVDGLAVVVEHAGWPQSGDDAETEAWRSGLEALADLGDRVHCKVSGMSMAAGSLRADALAPWVEGALEIFGVDRCFFASNFPVDGMHGSLDELWSAYAAITEGLSDDQVDALFAANAERLYRC